MHKSWIRAQINFSVLYRGGVSPWECHAILCADEPLAPQARAMAQREVDMRKEHFGTRVELSAVLSVFWCNDGWWNTSYSTDADGAGLSWAVK